MSARITWPAYLGAAALYEVFRRLRSSRGKQATSLRELLASRHKSRQGLLYRIPRNSTLSDAAHVMLAQRVDAVVVENSDDGTPARTGEFRTGPTGIPVPAGLVTHTGLLQAALASKLPLHKIPINQALTPMEESCYVLPDNSVEDTLALLAACKQLHAPVLSDHPRHGMSSVLDMDGHEAPARLLAVISLPELLGLTEAKRAERAKLWRDKSELMGMPTAQGLGVPGMEDGAGQLGRQAGGQGTAGAARAKGGLPLMM